MRASIKNSRTSPVLFILLLLIFLNPNNARAQGWTFIPSLKFTGDCEGSGAAAAAAQSALASFGSLKLPSKSQCESLRQQILAIQISGGDCTVGYTCTPCSGSDVIYPGQENLPGQIGASGITSIPGQINPDGYFQGKPLFSRHESAAFEEWATEYKQLLASFGITSILGKDIIPNSLINTPLTGELAMDTTYARLTAEFNPQTQPENPYSQDASVVDLTHLGDKPGVVQLLTTAEEQRKRDEWLKEQEVALTPDIDITDTSDPPFLTDELKNDLTKLGLNIGKFILVGAATPIAIEGAAGVAVTLAATAVICVGFKEFEAISDYYFEGKPLPSLKNLIVNSLDDVAIDVVSTGLGQAAGALAKNSTTVQNLLTEAKISAGVLPGIAKLSTAEMKATGALASKVETAFGLGYEAGSEGQTVNELIKKYRGK